MKQGESSTVGTSSHASHYADRPDSDTMADIASGSAPRILSVCWGQGRLHRNTEPEPICLQYILKKHTVAMCKRYPAPRLCWAADCSNTRQALKVGFGFSVLIVFVL